MKQLGSVFLVLVYLFYSGNCHTTLPPETIEKSGFLFPEGNGIADFFKDVVKNMFNPYNTEHLHNDVIFQLYTRSQSNTYTTLKPTEVADVGDFDSQKETKILIHGWRSSGKSMDTIRKGYLEAGDYNVIVVDWSKPAANLYFTAISNMNFVGEYLATLIDVLVTYHGLRPEHVHIIGHSLGGQMAGIAGSLMRSGKPGRITGLDPAAPFFCCKSMDKRLDSTDGQFVDVIHTSGGLLGWKAPIGHADFYPNGGTAEQPGCDLEYNRHAEKHPGTALDIFSCSHSRALDYFAESISTTSDFVSYKCPSWNDFKQGKCFQNSGTLMGEFTDTSSRGSYYLQTANSPPYALGNISTVKDVKEQVVTVDLCDSILCK